METNFPVLIVAYARPEGLRKLLEISYASGIRNIYVAIDGPKNEEVANRQIEILSTIQHFEFNKKVKIKTWRREYNLGAAVSVVTAIDWFFEYENAGLILEDDLVPSLDFFRFANAGLQMYEQNSDIWMVSGSRMNTALQDQVTNDWSFYPMIWGWATWRSRWSEMRAAFDLVDKINIARFFSSRNNFWKVGASRANSGMVDAWDMPLAYFQWSSSKYSIIPPVNLVTNVGFDSAATHTSGDVFPLNHPVGDLPLTFEFQSTPNRASAKNYDQLLERNLFGIRWHHSFLNIYRKPLDKVRNQSKNLGRLQLRLNAVMIPRNYLQP